jgi:hypothetical protein
MRFHSTHSRDSSLRRLSRVNRWLIGASVALTALFAEAAAHAFPGKSAAAATSKHAHARRHTGHPGEGSSSKSTRSLRPPAEAPRATTTSESPPPAESSTSGETAPTEESAPAVGAPPAEESVREPEPESAHESAPVQESPPPVVSGGS